MLMGSHVSMSGKKMLLGSAQEAASFKENTFMIYTGAPQNTKRKPISEMNIPAGKEYMKEHDLSHIVVHAPYIINLGNTKAPEKFNFAVEFLHDEIKRAEALGSHQMTLHPGAHVGAGPKAAIENIAKGLNEVLTADQTIQIAIETMAGKGTEVGRTFEQIAEIIDKVKLNDKLSVTFDTCHTNDAGYDIKDDFEGVLNEFDHIIGLDRLKVIHLNDSKNPRGSHKDRHANIGFGTIGFDALDKIAHFDELKDIPKILETPFIGPDKKHKYAPYGYEIKMLRAQKFDPNLQNEVLENKGKLK
ncbi:deoxyribonuclease IV [Ligilactobacillus sp. LYQ135]